MDFTSSTARREAWRNFDPTASWSATNKAWKIDVGGFITDPNRTFFGRLLQVYSRWTWELPQTLLGKTYTHVRNLSGKVDRVDYFGGATFATNENSDKQNGISLGSYVNINFKGEVDDRDGFEQFVLKTDLYRHEYGHTFDSHIFGLSYLLAIGVPSIISASSSSQINGEPRGVTTHKFRWYEMGANKHAARYFKKYYGVDWNKRYRNGTIETYYPRKKR